MKRVQAIWYFTLVVLTDIASFLALPLAFLGYYELLDWLMTQNMRYGHKADTLWNAEDK